MKGVEGAIERDIIPNELVFEFDISFDGGNIFVKDAIVGRNQCELRLLESLENDVETFDVSVQVLASFGHFESLAETGASKSEENGFGVDVVAGLNSKCMTSLERVLEHLSVVFVEMSVRISVLVIEHFVERSVHIDGI